jgi:hypothetical protein
MIPFTHNPFLCSPTCPFPLFILSHTYSQDLEAHLNSLFYDFAATQKEAQKFNANITTIDKNMHSTIYENIENLKHDLSTQLEFFTSPICTKLNITGDLTSSDPPFHLEGETSSNAENF